MERQPPGFDVSCVAHVHSTYSDGTATVPELLAYVTGGVDLETAEPADLAPDPGVAGGFSSGSAALASARELLDAAEAWRGRPVVPA